jgi:hypothetical protein
MKRVFVALVVIAALLVSVAILPGFAATKSPVGPLSFGLYSYELRSRLNADAYWKCDYSVFAHSVAGDKINAAILKEIVSRTPSLERKPAANSIEEAAAAFIKEYNDLVTSQKEHARPWQSGCSGEVLLDRPGIVTVSISSYAYTGGAHGMSVTQYLVFDAATGKQLGLADFLAQGFEAQLDKLIERRFRKMRGLSESEPLTGEKGLLFDNAIRHNENFAVTGSGICFLYNQYEIAPYSAGQITIDFSFDDLKEILKPLPENK